jgi:hypothetical protein
MLDTHGTFLPVLVQLMYAELFLLVAAACLIVAVLTFVRNALLVAVALAVLVFITDARGARTSLRAWMTRRIATGRESQHDHHGHVL